MNETMTARKKERVRLCVGRGRARDVLVSHLLSALRPETEILIPLPTGKNREAACASVQYLSFGMRIRSAEIKLHRLPQEHLQAQPVSFGPNLKISADITRDGD
jgi:hypothetical protein